MQPERSSRIDTAEFKAQLLKKVGQERFKMYFHCLNRFINQKLSKSEFDKSCFRILGRENLPLHNQIIRVILKNASSSKTPPPLAHEAVPANKTGVAGGKISHVVEGGRGQGTVTGQHQSSVAPIWSNGVVPISPRKGRSTVRDRKLKDRKVNVVPQQSTVTNDVCGKALANGDLGPCDFRRPLQRPHGFTEKPENDAELVMNKPAETSTNLAHVADGEEAARASQLIHSKRPLVAPLGIPLCSSSSGVARKALPVTHIGDYVSCFDLGGLSDSEVLRRRMEQIAATQGLGVTLECSNTLNNMVDVYLKRLVRSCLELVGSRSTSDASTNPIPKQQMHGKPVNGLWPSNHVHMQNNSGGAVEPQRLNESVSLLDFKVAMELNPQQLGKNWPLLLEKISMQGFDE